MNDPNQPSSASASAPTPTPVKVEMPLSQPTVTYILLGMNVLIFLLNIVTGGALVQAGVKDNQAIVNGEYYRLFSAMFLHQEIWHIGFNMYALYVIGSLIERFFGHVRYLIIYILAGLAGFIASYALLPYPALGASGAISGIFGAMIPFWYRNRHILRDTRRRLIDIAWLIGINLAIGIISYINVLKNPSTRLPVVDNWGHLGGLIGGLILAWFATPRYVVGDMENGRLQIIDDSSPVIRWVAFVIFSLLLIAITGLLTIIRT